jgi:uncharacterized DUF497 family protein
VRWNTKERNSFCLHFLRFAQAQAVLSAQKKYVPRAQRTPTQEKRIAGVAHSGHQPQQKVSAPRTVDNLKKNLFAKAHAVLSAHSS